MRQSTPPPLPATQIEPPPLPTDFRKNTADGNESNEGVLHEAEEIKQKYIPKQGCTIGLNLILTLLVFYQSFSIWLFQEGQHRRCNISTMPWSYLPWSYIFPYTEVVFGVFSILVILFISPVIILIVWNRLVANVFSVQKISYVEAYAAFQGLTFISGLLS